jgi:hypothetical protein
MSTLSEALALITEAEDRVKRARELLQRETSATEVQGVWPGGLLLAEILREGGSVSRERLYELAEKYGFDRRGLGGFYTGKGSLQMLDEMDRVMLTPEGVKTARRYLKRSPYESQEPQLARLAEPSFAEDWSSEADSLYDNV